jgi:uncharacterized protein (TIGR03437 family)
MHLKIMAAGFLALIVTAQTPTLTVTDGYASRNPKVGAKAYIWAQQNTATRVFAGWSGDTGYLLDPLAPHTTLVVPPAPVNLRATYKTVPAWSVQTGTFGSIPVSYFIPQNPVGLVFVFHGSGGTGPGQFTSSEFLSLMRDLVAERFGVAAFTSLDRANAGGRWDTNTNNAANPDVVRLNTVIAGMRAQSVISSTLPLLAFGHSNGGQFAHLTGPVMNWAAVSISSVQGSPSSSQTYTGPVAWWMAKNDDHPEVGLAGGIATSLTRYETHVNRRVAGQHMIQEPVPLYPERFARSLYLTMADSLEVYGIFRNRGWLDENDFLTRNPNQFDWQSAIPSRYTDTMKISISGQLEGTFMTHEFTNFSPHVTTGMFLQALGLKPIVRPVSGASFEGTSLASESIATVFTPGLAPELEVSASGPQVALQGATASIRSAAGTESAGRWFFVSPGQGSFLVPSGLAAGDAVLKIQGGDRRVALPVKIAATSPGIFTANGNGQGAPAAVILRVSPDNTRSTEFPFAAGANGFVAAPIRFQGDRLFLDLYATGVRGSTNVQVLLGGETIAPLYAGAQPQFVGLDQVTFELPPNFAGRGRVEVVIVAGGVRSNVVELNFAN